MSEQDNPRRAPMSYIATACAYCFDLAAMAFLVVSASVMAERELTQAVEYQVLSGRAWAGNGDEIRSA